MRVSIEQEYEKTVSAISDGLFYGNKKAYQLYNKLSLEDQVRVDNLLLKKQCAVELLIAKHQWKVKHTICSMVLVAALIILCIVIIKM